MQSKGFYLYAIRPSFVPASSRLRRASAFSKLSADRSEGKPAGYSAAVPEIKGIDNGGHVFTIIIGGQIEAVVSLVNLKDFDADEIRERAQNDLAWIKEKSLIHNRVIMESAEGTDGAIVPMKFGSIFNDRGSLSKAIKKDSKNILSLFEKLRGKEEWSVKVFAEPEAIKKEIIKSDIGLQNKKEELDSLPAGLAYFKEKELEDEIEKRKRSEFQKWRQEVLQILPRFTDEVKVGKILGKELTARLEPMILNAALLINKRTFNKFSEDVARWQGILKERGLLVETSGPWPPYNFI